MKNFYISLVLFILYLDLYIRNLMFFAILI